MKKIILILVLVGMVAGVVSGNEPIGPEGECGYNCPYQAEPYCEYDTTPTDIEITDEYGMSYDPPEYQVVGCVGEDSCKLNDPEFYYYENCGWDFDWNEGDLQSVILARHLPAGIELLINKLNDIGDNLGSLDSQYLGSFNTAFNEHIGFEDDEFDIGGCLSNSFCSIDYSGSLTLTPRDADGNRMVYPDGHSLAGQEMPAQNFDLADLGEEGDSISSVRVVVDQVTGDSNLVVVLEEATITDPDTGDVVPAASSFMFNGQLVTIINEGEVSDGSFVFHSDGSMAIPAGGVISIPSGCGSDCPHDDTVRISATLESGITVYNGAYSEGTSLNGVYLENVGDYDYGDHKLTATIANVPCGVVFGSSDNRNSAGILTSVTGDAPGSYSGAVSITRTGDIQTCGEPVYGGNYDVDLTGYDDGPGNVVVTGGQQAIILDDESMWACNPYAGSCPTDFKSRTNVVVHYNHDRYPGEDISLTMVAQTQIYDTFGILSTCSCDRNAGCDNFEGKSFNSCGVDYSLKDECTCDVACSLDKLPEAGQIIFGYETGCADNNCTADGSCPKAYGGRGWHIYLNGEIILNSNFQTVDNAALIFNSGTLDSPGSNLMDNCKNIRLNSDVYTHCTGSVTQATDTVCPNPICEVIDVKNTSCRNCLKKCETLEKIEDETNGDKNKCSFTDDNGIEKIVYVDWLDYEDETDSNGNLLEDYEKGNYTLCNNETASVLVDFYCTKHCGYCDSHPFIEFEIGDLSGSGSISVNLNERVKAPYSQTVDFDKESFIGSDCSCVIGYNSPPNPLSCSGEVGDVNQYSPHELRCSGSGTCTIEIKATGECGLTNKDDVSDSYQTFEINLG